MNNIFRALDRMKDEHNITDRQKHIIGATLEHIEHEKNRECKDCVHFSEGLQPDGIGWEECEWNYQCSVPLESRFELRKIND